MAQTSNFSIRRILRKILIARRRATASYTSPLTVDLAKVKVSGVQPFVSVHVAVYNEKRVVERLIRACTAQEWHCEKGTTSGQGTTSTTSYKDQARDTRDTLDSRGTLANYEVIIVDDSTDETTEIAKETLVSEGWKLVKTPDVILGSSALQNDSRIQPGTDSGQALRLYSGQLKGSESYRTARMTGKALELFIFTKPNAPTVKLIHRFSRFGFKGGALQKALEETDGRSEYIVVLDADFIPYPDTIEQFVKTFQVLAEGQPPINADGKPMSADSTESAKSVNPPQSVIAISSEAREKQSKTKIASSMTPRNDKGGLGSQIAAVQGYQWHVLNKSQNWVTRGVRTEYAGSYVIERSTEELYGGLKQIAGSVYAIRADVLRKFGWGISITEDFELTLRLYEAGFKIVFTPYIQVPAEAVSTIKRLIRQRMRWAEGSSFNIKVMFIRMVFGRWEEETPSVIASEVESDSTKRSNLTESHSVLDTESIKSGSRIKSGMTDGEIAASFDELRTRNDSHGKVWVPSPLTRAEKLEFVYFAFYYLQAAFFVVGTFSWFISETIFNARLPFWTAAFGWSLVFTNLLALPLMNIVGMFLEESDERDYVGILSFIALSYIVVPFQAYAAIKGFLEKEEGPWFRTPKTGMITDVFGRSGFGKFFEGLLRKPAPIMPTGADLSIANPGLSSYSKPGLYDSSWGFNQRLALATANNTFNHFHLKPKRVRYVGKAFLAILLILSLHIGYLSSFVPLANASPGTQIKTVEYFIYQYASATDITSGQGVNGTTYSDANDISFTVDLPESGTLTVRHAYVEWTTKTGTQSVSSGEMKFDRATCSGARTNTTLTLGAAVATSTELYPLIYRMAVTAEMAAGSNNYCFNAQLTGTSLVRNSDNAKLVITYEYDDAATTQLRTRKYFVACDTGTTANVPATVNPSIQEVGATVKSAWVEYSGHFNSAQAGDGSVSIDFNGSAGSEIAVDDTGLTTHDILAMRNVTSIVNLNGANNITLDHTTQAISNKCAELVITYSFTPYSTLTAASDSWCSVDGTPATNDGAGDCNSNWARRLKITFNNSASTENLASFPVLVVLDSTRIDYTQTQANGQDLRFVDASAPTALLDHEIEKWNEAATSYVWVKVPQIDSGSTTDYIVMYYGNSNAADGQDITNVWDTNYKGVWHLDEAPANGVAGHLDSTVSSNEGTPNNFGGTSESTTNATGQIDGADRLDGTDDFVNVPRNSAFEPATAITVAVWFNWDDNTPSSYGKIVNKSTVTVDPPFVSYEITQWASEATVAFTMNVGGTQYSTTTEALSLDSWHYLVGTWNSTGQTLRLYVDGVQTDTNAGASGSITYYATDLRFGFTANAEPSTNIDGTIDEVRISDLARSAEWLEAEYKNGADTFSTFGCQENSSGCTSSFPLQGNTVVYAMGQNSGDLATSQTTIGAARTIVLPEASKSYDRVWVRYTLTTDDAANFTPQTTSNRAGSSTNTGSAYAIPRPTEQAGKNIILFDITTWFANTANFQSGDQITAKAQSGTANTLEDVGAELLISFRHDQSGASLTGAKTVYWFVGQRATAGNGDFPGSFTTYLPESSETLRSAAVVMDAPKGAVSTTALTDSITVGSQTCGAGGTDNQSAAYLGTAENMTTRMLVVSGTNAMTNMAGETVNWCLDVDANGTGINDTAGAYGYTTFTASIVTLPENVLPFLLLMIFLPKIVELMVSVSERKRWKQYLIQREYGKMFKSLGQPYAVVLNTLTRRQRAYAVT